MSLLTILFLSLIVVLVYIRLKIGELVNVVEKRIEDVRQLVSHPGRIASAMGEAVVDTAVEQVSRMTDSRKKRKKR